MTVTLEQCCAAKVHLTICDDDGYCEFCGNQDSCTSTPDLTPVSYDRALRIVCDFTEGLSSESPEYERGQLEMLADMFPAANVETDCRMTQIAREIRAMYAAETAAMRRVDTTAPNDLADMSVQSAAEYLTALVEDGCTGYVRPADGHVYIHHTGDTCPIHETGVRDEQARHEQHDV